MAQHCQEQKQKKPKILERVKTMTYFRKVLFAVLALSASACTNTHSAPSMLDYSYVPPQYAKGGATSYGLEDF